MKLEMYGLKDNVEGEFIFFFQAKNEGIMKRAVEGLTDPRCRSTEFVVMHFMPRHISNWFG